MAKKFQTHYSGHQVKGEVFRRPSKTIPDQTMTVREIMERYAKGLPIDGAKVPVYDGEDVDMPDLRTLDISEREELRQQLDDDVSTTKNRLQEIAKERAEKTRKRKQAEEKREEQTPPPPPPNPNQTELPL